MEGSRMFKLPVRTWVRNAAAVFSGQYGSVTGQAQDSQCSRETVYEHARKVEERLAEASSNKSRLAEQETEIQRLQRRVAELEALAQQPVVLDPVKQRKFATVASAPGVEPASDRGSVPNPFAPGPGTGPFNHRPLGQNRGETGRRGPPGARSKVRNKGPNLSSR